MTPIHERFSSNIFSMNAEVRGSYAANPAQYLVNHQVKLAMIRGMVGFPFGKFIVYPMSLWHL
jgi:hypothetical protein